jgi:hypothetical protein
MLKAQSPELDIPIATWNNSGQQLCISWGPIGILRVRVNGTFSWVLGGHLCLIIIICPRTQ